ncbi:MULTISPECIES: hypothetical protein [Sphingobium]|nr:hypothetical protein [Sphingobium yanoikuyae]
MAEGNPSPKGRKRPLSSGFRNRRIRDFQTLPYSWDRLTAVDVDHLKGIVCARLQENIGLFELELCLLIWASLTTGRSYKTLLPLSFHTASNESNWVATSPALVRNGENWAWWLDLRDRADPKPTEAGTLTLSERIYLPVTDLTVTIIDRCLAQRKCAPDRFAQPLFTHWEVGRYGRQVAGEPDEQDLLVETMMHWLERHDPQTGRKARDAAATTASLTRWLPATMNEAAGGDMVLTAAITGIIPSMAEASSAYGALSQDRLARHYRSSINGIDTLPPVTLPATVAATHIGGRFTPTDETVGDLVRSLAEGLEAAPRPIEMLHQAMTRYSVGLLAFALAHRGITGSLPASKDVDDNTRFYSLTDKNVRGTETQRLVWLCDTAMEQLRLYDEHVKCLEDMLPEETARQVGQIREQRDLPLFRLKRHRSKSFDRELLTAEPIKVTNAIGQAMAVQHLRKNAGRHWLRTKLVGQCSTETIHAFYGHGPLDSGSWDMFSALDPAVYRADLARTLDPVLQAAGWIPRAANLAIATL